MDTPGEATHEGHRNSSKVLGFVLKKKIGPN
jgi:hypothetical protein